MSGDKPQKSEKSEKQQEKEEVVKKPFQDAVDDEFEDFPSDSGTVKTLEETMAEDKPWQDSWEDEDQEEDFATELKNHSRDAMQVN